LKDKLAYDKELSMNRKLMCLAAITLVHLGSHESSAQLGPLLREGFEYAVKGSAQATREGAQEGLERALPQASRGLSKGVAAAAETPARHAATQAARTIGREATEAVSRHSNQVCQKVVNAFGDEGGRALSALSAESGERLAQLAPDLARHPEGSKWLATIAQHGDAAVTWLWQCKGSLAVATAATAVLLRPAEFIEASEHVATEAITTTGKHVVQPLIDQTALHVAEPLIREVAAPVTRQALPSLGLATTGMVCAGGGWYLWRYRRRASR
jgi:hypothetical protein